MQDAGLSEEEMGHFIQLCLSDEDVPEEELQTLEDIMRTESTRAREIALRLLDESMIRSWFRSEADSAFITEVQKRLKIRFKDREFIEAVMSKVEEGVNSSAPGEAGQSVIKEDIKSVSMLKYILVPLSAALIYLCVFQLDFIKAFFTDKESYMMTVQDIQGRPTIISADKRKAIILKMLIKPSDTLNSGFNERIYLKYPDQTKVELNPSTSAILVKSYTSKEMQLLNGSIKLSVTPQQEDTPMIVQSAYASVRISEGVTIISLLGDMDSILVLSGSATVEHANGTDTKTVTAGNFLTLDQQQFFEIEKIKKEKRETSDE